MAGRRAEVFLMCWSPILLWTTIVVLPVKGSTPAFLMAFLCLPVLLAEPGRGRVLRDLALMAALFASYFLLAKLVQSMEGVPGGIGLVYVSTEAWNVQVRASHLTQSLYLLPGVLTFLFFRDAPFGNTDRYLGIAACSLAGFGLYEFVYFLIFNTSGDFISNRTFGPDQGAFAGAGDVFQQTMDVGGRTIERLRGLTNEPSMYAFSILPFFVYFLSVGRLGIAVLLLVTLALSTSTTALLGLLVYAVTRVVEDAVVRRNVIGLFTFLIGAAVVTAVLALFFGEAASDIFQAAGDKLAGNNESGMERGSSLAAHLAYWLSLPPGQMLFGIGFGTVRSADMISTLLVNVGLVGVLIFSAIMLYPAFRLGGDAEGAGLRHALLQIYVTAMVSVPEFSYLSIWVFLGLAYRRLRVPTRARPGRGGAAWARGSLAGLALLMALPSPGRAAEQGMLWGVVGHLDQGGSYAAVPLPAQMALLRGAGLAAYRTGLDRDTAAPAIAAAAAHGVVLLSSLEIWPDERLAEAGNYALGFRHAMDRVSAHRGRLVYFEASNELDNWVGMAAEDGSRAEHYDQDRYPLARGLLRGLIDGVHAADPQARVLVDNAGWCHYGFLHALWRDGVRWDITAIHWYASHGRITEAGCGGVDVLAMHAAFGRPIWITEFGSDIGAARMDSMEQGRWLAAFMAELEPVAARYGVQAAFIYQLLDQPGLQGGEAHFGIADAAGRPKPAYEAVRAYVSPAGGG